MKKTSRKSFLSTTAILSGGLLTSCNSITTSENKLKKQIKPNIILCMTDKQGWGHSGYNDHPVLRTPHLDKMAKKGLQFNRFYADAPVCSPPRGICITGRHPYRYGIPNANTGKMKEEEHTLAEILKTQGYATGHLGK
jgi:arylsulfatase A-like enzyme